MSTINNIYLDKPEAILSIPMVHKVNIFDQSPKPNGVLRKSKLKKNEKKQ